MCPNIIQRQKDAYGQVKGLTYRRVSLSPLDRSLNNIEKARQGEEKIGACAGEQFLSWKFLGLMMSV